MKVTKKHKMAIGGGIAIAIFALGLYYLYAKEKPKKNEKIKEVCNLTVYFTVKYGVTRPVGATMKLTNIKEKKSYFKTITDEGLYYFRNIPLGEYNLEIGYGHGVGYVILPNTKKYAVFNIPNYEHRINIAYEKELEPEVLPKDAYVKRTMSKGDGSLRFEVVDESGNPLSSVTVTLTHPKYGFYMCFTGKGNTCNFIDIPSGVFKEYSMKMTMTKIGYEMVTTTYSEIEPGITYRYKITMGKRK